ncbi:unnamed protein product [Prunus armeniaca]|uniref:COBRA C-terminal domain-containing protein n=1 Tax=Prunus armeniaca TaxID=36596 RepID=A0A6J5UHW2_PRUAR|nr:unnamed protein product [Prunus armeniaca]
MPTCCVSLSAFYDSNIVSCPTCSCGCPSNTSSPQICAERDAMNSFEPLVRCSDHMCPIRVHWHIMMNYKKYWRLSNIPTSMTWLEVSASTTNLRVSMGQ